ncbi:hydroxymethylbilane synthase [Jatrophihabitans telluris]|uniref:Porphobilinogen deaminase n=1 Tax=Jatrophihabitans telluris TaxID=2038343 RepID=A0ABY4QZW0_9ACTN|nr:hydroxymethylbilane synthase [Jatrophihabitans telluris]UQX88873.1 hydroxymethylbilane synthase [Jatrophihabitans telluris]
MTATRTIRVGTRASLLARTQTDTVVNALAAATPGLAVDTVLVSTQGDRSGAPLEQIGGTGVFVSALRDALLAGDIDVAVHSYKDLPTAPVAGIALAAVPLRQDPRDALVARDELTLLELPVGATVGTGSPRRAAQLRAMDLGLDIVSIRGNVDTRLGRVLGSTGVAPDLDAVVLAVAGLQRLSRAHLVTELIDPMQMLPAAAQGALAIECRADDADLLATLAGLDDHATRSAVTAERSLLAALEAGCTAPVGALADVVETDGSDDLASSGSGWDIYLRGSVTAIDGSDAVRLSISGPLDTAEELGRRLAADLIDLGATTMMGSSK